MTEHKANEKGALRRSRTSHAERTANMRKRLIDAAIECLNEVGLGMTTLQRITDRAKVSRGAFVHHFPTRVDLLIAVAEHAAVAQNTHVRRRLAHLQPGMQIFEAITMATWEAIVQPTAIALLEIMIGARSDTELARRFRPLIDRLEADQREAVWEQAQLAGIQDRDTILTMVHLHMAAMRGLALELMYSEDKSAADASMQLLQRYKARLTQDLTQA
ncbi:MAG: TetR/AcrR family transcriptional regulator [Hyphomonas sp.]